AGAPALAAIRNGQPDPIIAAIERYRAAAKVENDAEADFIRREKLLLDTVGQREPSIGVFNLAGSAQGPAYGQQCTAYSHDQIDALCPPDRFGEMNRSHHEFFEGFVKRHEEIMGDAERVRQDASEPRFDALADLVETVPTTMAGVFALIEWQRDTIDLDGQALHTRHYSILCDTIGDALRRLRS
uniref:hypothetical protein n=1 Tax=Bradyrhizobium sp. dw_411 TaxID=2720082 RepID=UPI001BD07143